MISPTQDDVGRKVVYRVFPVVRAGGGSSFVRPGPRTVARDLTSDLTSEKNVRRAEIVNSLDAALKLAGVEP